ncbi:MAG: PEP-CTERM sorting domain-containing protein, partial [Pirellulaceae bacterium]|nr:PEP-CTERM sorting domain-containing protein [Pirellulaceae bacterium]
GGACNAALMVSGADGYTAFDEDNDNYLTYTTTSSSTGGKGSVYRDYMGTGENASDIDFTQDYTIAFSVRVDDLSTFTATTDEISIFGDASANNIYNPGLTSTFVIKVLGSHADPTRALEWYFFDSDRNGQNINVGVRSGIYLVAGHVYDFEIEMHPGAKGYSVVLTDRTADLSYSSDESYEPDDLGWRGAEHGKYVSFASRASAANESVTVAIDNIRISQIPEPGILVMGFGLLLAGLVVRRRR